MFRYVLTLAVETLCLIGALYFLRDEKERHWRLHPWYLLIVVATEAVGGYIARVQGGTNTWLYNLFIPIEGLFISYFLYRLCQPYGMPYIHWILWVVLFGSCYLTERLLVDSLQVYSYWTLVFLSISFVGGSIRYAHLLIRAIPLPFLLHRHAPSLWVAAISLFYFGTFVSTLLAEPLITARVEIAGIPLYSMVYFLLNLMLYGLWIVTFMCRYRNLQ